MGNIISIQKKIVQLLNRHADNQVEFGELVEYVNKMSPYKIEHHLQMGWVLRNKTTHKVIE